MSLPLSPQVFAILGGLVEARSGLHYDADNLALFADKVSGPALEAGFDSLLDYYYFLRYDPKGPAALTQLIHALVVHETYFFRELEPMQALVDGLLVPRIQAGVRPRVWSAACSTGEEPLSLAMLLADRGMLDKVELHASDLSPTALDRARRGEFNSRSLRAVQPGIGTQWLETDGGRARVHPSLREAIRWSQVNLVEEDQVRALGLFDAILCRNVLIYFSDSTATRVVASLANALRPRGRLLVGTSESLLRYGTRLVCEEHRGAFFYVRPEDG